MKIIDGKKLAEKIKYKIVKELVKINQGDVLCNKRPNLAILLVGERPDSALYVRLKEQEAKKCGIDTELYKFSENADEKGIKEAIDFLNKDEGVDAILLQLPLPKKFNTDKIVKLIDPKKDLDGFHPENLKILLSDYGHDDVMPPLFQVIFEIFASIKYEMKEKTACVISNSEIFGGSLKKVLECRGAKAEVVNPKKENWAEKSKEADILITAIGEKHFIKGDNIKDGAVVIDIGISSEGGKVFGDVDSQSVKDKDGFITPVPGGVGPITIAVALKNTLEMYRKKIK